MKSVKISILLFFTVSNVISLELFDRLAIIPNLLKSSRKKNQVRLEQGDVYNGVKRILRSIFPDDEMNPDGDNNQGGKSAECFDCVEDQPQKPVKHEHSGHQKQDKIPGQKQKGSKYTNVNFVLYNSGIKFNKQDDAYNKQQIAKLRFNCILVVASENKCYGWDAKRNGTKDSVSGVGKGMSDIEKHILPAIMPLLTSNSSNGFGLDNLMHSPDDNEVDGNELSPTFRRSAFQDIIDDVIEEAEEPSQHFTIYI